MRNQITAALCSLAFATGFAAKAQTFLHESGKVFTSNPLTNELFGGRIAVDGDTMVIAAQQAVVGMGRPGAAYVFLRGSNGWANATLLAKLSASDGVDNDRFSASVAISGDTIVVGAPDAFTSSPFPFPSAAGAVYVFVRPPSGWVDMTETAKLLPSNIAAGDDFGFSVAIHGATIAVGSPRARRATFGNGAVYIFERPTTGWTSSSETMELLGQTGSNQQLGSSLAMDEDTIVAGADGLNQAGLVAVFEKPPSGWAAIPPSALLTASDGFTDNALGVSVSIDGGTIAAGATNALNGALAPAGATYVFERPATGWVDSTESAKLLASDGGTGDQLGISVAIEGDVILSGAPQASEGCTGSREGKVYVFERGTNWAATEVAQLSASDLRNDDYFGRGVALQGSTMMAGAPFGNSTRNNTGAAYLFAPSYVSAPGPTLTPLPGPLPFCSSSNVITLSGTNMCGLSSVLVGGNPVTLLSSTDTSAQIQLTSPLSPGTYPVTASNPRGTTNTVTLTITPSSTPSLSSLAPVQIVNRALPTTFSITGTDMDCGTSVSVGTTTATIVTRSPTSLIVSLPSGLPIGSYPVTVTSSQGTSNSLTLEITPSHPSVLVASGIHPSGATQPYRTWSDADWTVQYLLSAVDGTTAIPGILSLEIGGGVFANVVPVVALTANAAGLAEVPVTMPPGLPVPFTLYWECLTTDPSVPLGLQTPLETSNRVSVLTLF